MKKLKILVPEPNYIGDVLMSTPGLRALRKLYPEAEITAVTTKQGKEILEYNPAVNSIITRSGSINLPERISLAGRVRSIAPDIVFLFRTTFYYDLLSYLCGAKERYGIANEITKFLLTKSVKPDSKALYRGQFLETLSLSQEKGIAGEILGKLDIFTSDDDKNYANRFMSDNGLRNKMFVIISPGTTRHSKLWTAGSYARICGLLAEKNIKVVITGTKFDKIIGNIAKNMKQPPLTATDMTLRQYAELIKNAALFISSDTGGFYMSIAVETDSICLFGSTSPSKYGPFDTNKQKIIYRALDCSPCDKNICPNYGEEKTPCMEAITVEEVWNEIIKKIRI